MPPIKHTIHKAGLEGDLTTDMAEGGSVAQLFSFIPEEGSKFQMVSVPNRLVKPTHYMTRSIADELFRTIGMEGKDWSNICRSPMIC